MGKIPKETVEEILENLVAILEENEEAQIQTLAERLDMEVDELMELLQDISDMGLLSVRDDTVVPTSKGEKLGLKMVRKHRLLERFLYDVLGLRQENVHDEACKLEHALSDDAEKALCRFL